MSVSGFVLVGGQSRRMGRDKALLPYAGGALVQSIAAEVRAAAGDVSLLGDPLRYRHLRIPVVPDLIPGKGPMSGLHAALHFATTDWILLVACDLPNIDRHFLRELIAHAAGDVKCAAARSHSGLEPLCAVYHRSTRVQVETALKEGRLRMRDLIAQLGAIGVAADGRLVRNVNTEEDWRLHLSEKK